MTVIAMTREMGSLGKDVAMSVAQMCGLKTVQHEIVDQVAGKMNMYKSQVNRFLEGEASMLERWGVDEDTLSLYTAREIIELAEGGNVLIRGWGAAYLLRSIPHVLCIRVCAPMEFRVKVMMERLEIDDEEFARREIEKNDLAHAETMLRLYHLEDWRDSALYDLTLNTARVSIKDCVQQITALAASESFRETPESLARLRALKLEVQIREALKENPGTADSDSVIKVDPYPGNGAVALRGGVFTEAERREVERVVSRLPGVTRVINELLVASRYADA